MILAALIAGAPLAAWIAGAGTNYQEDCKTIIVGGVKCTGCSRCYEPKRVGTPDQKIPPWEFKGEGYSKAEKAITHISIASQLVVNGEVIDEDSQEADNSSYVHSEGYGTGGDWWECVYKSYHKFTVKTTGQFRTDAGWSSKGN